MEKDYLNLKYRSCDGNIIQMGLALVVALITILCAVFTLLSADMLKWLLSGLATLFFIWLTTFIEDSFSSM